MKQTTEAIVLGLSKHSDKISLLHVYSRTEGRLMLQVYGANGKKKQRAQLCQKADKTLKKL